jgi:hypothetical protein
VVKRAASDCLAKYGIHKANAEFKEIWGFVYRGTEFALVRLSPCPCLWDNTETLKNTSQRTQMQSRAIESRAAEKFAKVHAEMYVKRTIPGGTSGVQEGRNRCSSINGRPHDNDS